MDIYIKWDNDEKKIRIPILPESISQNESMNNTSLYVHNKGEVNLKGKRNLKTVSWSSFFPGKEKYDFQHGDFHDPYDYYCKKLKDLEEKNETVHLIVTDTDINFYCTIDQFDHGPQEKVADVGYTISFKEHREVNRLTKNKKKPSTKPQKKKKAWTGKWKKGDTWHALCKKHLGSSSEWKTKRKDNTSVIHKAKKAHPKKKETVALIGYTVTIKP